MLRTERLSVSAGGRLLIRELDWRVGRGEFWCILGRNGVGKSTLLHVLAGLAPPVSGTILLEGSPLAAIAPGRLALTRGLMPQAQADAFSSPVLDTVMIGRSPYRFGAAERDGARKWWRRAGDMAWDRAEDRLAALAALDSVGLAGRADDDVTRLSGGERQRVALATLLAQAPALLMLDEPTAHQDVAQQLAMMRLIRKATSDHAAIATCHDINLAARFATHVLVLAPDRHWAGTVDDILRVEVLERAFECGFHETAAGDGANLFVAG